MLHKANGEVAKGCVVDAGLEQSLEDGLDALAIDELQSL